MLLQTQDARLRSLTTVGSSLLYLPAGSVYHAFMPLAPLLTHLPRVPFGSLARVCTLSTPEPGCVN
jgi:hypothetical protein